LNAAAILKQANSAGVKLSLNGDKLAVKWAAKPPESLIEAIKAEKANIMAILKCATSYGAVLAPVTPPPKEAGEVPPTSQAPLGVSRRLVQALDLAAHYHVRFEFDEAGLFVTRPPRDYKREVQAAERALMAVAQEIKMICGLPERPKFYEDQAWVRAVVDSARLGYRNWRGG
jgi:hypothetical protein